MLPLHVPPSYPGGAGRGLMASVSSSSGGRGGGRSGGSMRASLGSMSSLHDVGAPRTEDSATMRKVTALGLVVGVSSFVILVVFAVLSARMLNMEAGPPSRGLSRPPLPVALPRFPFHFPRQRPAVCSLPSLNPTTHRTSSWAASTPSFSLATRECALVPLRCAKPFGPRCEEGSARRRR